VAERPGDARFSASKRIKLIAVGNVAVGFIAIGNVAVGVVAIGFAVAVGPIAIGLNSVGWLMAIGLNAVGTLSLASINGLGVRTFAGVNGLGVFCNAGTNQGESVLIGVLMAICQCIAALALAPKLRAPGKVEPTEEPTRLADLVNGLRDTGRVEVTVRNAGPDQLDVTQHGCKASLSAPGSVADEAKTFAFLHPNDRAILDVRASLEPVEAVPGTDYRKAPETRRVLVAERAEPAPTPEPWWAPPSTMARIAFASLLGGGLISAILTGSRILR
jgi:hypothetical protein